MGQSEDRFFSAGVTGRIYIAFKCIQTLVFSVVVMVGLVFSADASDASETNNQYIQSGAEIHYPPFSFVNAHGEADGFSIELMRAALAAMEHGVRFRTGPWAEVRGWLERGEVDALPLVGRTPEREALFDFTVPYMTLHGAVVVRDDETGIQGLTDLRGRSVAVMKGDNAEEFLRREDRGIDIHTFPTFEIAFQELARGRHDAVVVQRLVALRLIRKTGLTGLKVLEKPIQGFQQDFCFAVQEGDRDTLAMLNEGLAIVVADGTQRRLQSKWLAAMQLPSDRPIVVGGDRNYPPYEFIDENGRPTGYNVDLIRAVAREMGLNIQTRLGQWTERIEALENGKIDVMQGMFYSAARDGEFDFTPPHTVTHYVAVVRKDRTPAPVSAEGLAGKRILVENADILHDFVLENGLENQVTAVSDQEEALRRLSEGDFDCALVSLLTAFYLMDKNGWTNLVTGKKPILVSEYCFAVREGRKALLAQFSEGLKAVENSGEYRRIHDKWFGVYEKKTTTFVDALRYSAIVILPLLLFLLLAFTWTGLLRRKVAEKTRELHESLERFQYVFEAANVGKSITFPDGRMNPNKAFAGFLGYTRDELKGRRWQDLTIPEDMETTDAIVHRMASGEVDIGRFEKQYIHKSGRLLWADVSGVVRRDDKGKPLYFITTIVDITDRKHYEKRIEHLNKVLRAIRDINQLMTRERKRENLIQEGCRLLVAHRGYSFAMIMLTSEEGRPVEWALEGSAFDSEPLTAQLSKGELPPCCRQVMINKNVRVIEDRQDVCHTCENTCVGDVGPSLCAPLIHEQEMFGYVVVSVEKELVVDDEEKSLFGEMAGDFAYALNVMRIEAVQHENEALKQKLESQLIQAQKMESIGRLAGGVAHDFNNMLGVIIGYAELAIGKVSPEVSVHSDLKEILVAAGRSAAITRQLLAFARKETIAPEVLDLNSAVKDMLNMLHRLIGEDIDLSWNPGSEVWPVKLDPSQLNQILANLCVNARDAISDVGKITIETGNIRLDSEYCREHVGFLPGEYVLMAVSDNGCGMDRKTLENIFEPFFTTKEMDKGTGLGLAMIYGIVKQNEGFINVYSEPDQGTTVRIYLPRHMDASIPAEVHETGETPVGSKETILVVEDETSILKLTKMILQRLNYTVLGASTPGEASEIAEEYRDQIHLLITDVVMPEMNGKDLAEKLQLKYPGLKVLFMSGYTANVIAHHGVLDSGVHFVQKPFSSIDLGDKVKEALAG